jgi:hypothetical protein
MAMQMVAVVAMMVVVLLMVIEEAEIAFSHLAVFLLIRMVGYPRDELVDCELVGRVGIDLVEERAHLRLACDEPSRREAFAQLRTRHLRVAV